MTTTFELLKQQMADELGDQAREHLSPETRKNLITQFRSELGMSMYRILLTAEERDEAEEILHAAELELSTPSPSASCAHT